MGKRRKPQKVIGLSDYILDDNGPLIDGSSNQLKGIAAINDSEYKNMFGEGLISIEELDEEESARILSSYKPKDLKIEKNSKKNISLNSNSSENLVKETKKKKNTEVKKIIKVSKGDSNLPEWNDNLDPLLKIALNDLELRMPTQIQKEILSFALSDNKRDIFGCAPTGSGKTLAFLLPILQYCIKERDNTDKSFAKALIIVPTRELAIQINNVLRSLLLFIPNIYSITLVGGLSDIKQKRVLSHSPEIIVGTPGRIADLLCKGGDGDLALKKLKFLVMDEADRLVERGHFKDLDIILTTIQKNHWSERSTMLFSATLKMEDLSLIRKKIQFTNPFIVDLKTANPILLRQFSIYSLPEDRNSTLLTLLLEIFEKEVKVLVFVNAIETVREISTFLAPFTSLLPCPQTMHAHMQQKQRMKHLETFTKNSKAIMVTSDVAARGIDIPEVDYVIHYHVPRRKDTFLHRSGRTARAQRNGSSILLITPADVALLDGLGIGKDDEKYIFSPKYHSFLYGKEELAQKVSILSDKLTKSQLKANKAKRETSWKEKASEILGIELSGKRNINSIDYDSDDNDSPTSSSSSSSSSSPTSINDKDRSIMMAEIAEIIKKIN